MAAIAPTTHQGSGRSNTIQVKWSTVTEADTCDYYDLSDFPDRSVHVYGTFGGATVAVKGSNETGSAQPSNPVSLQDAEGAAIAIATAAGLLQLLENCRWIAPVPEGGSGQSLTIIINATKRGG